MESERKFEVIFLIFTLIFSWWLMVKSFSYDQGSHRFLIGRNEVGDFGLHLALIRSFSQGSNFPVESPFYPGKSLPYHFYFDAITGLLERIGIRIDLAVNGLSAFGFTLILYLIYKLAQLVFGKSRLLGITSVLLFSLPTNTSFIDYFKNIQLNLDLFRQIRTIPDLISKGPFDGSLTSIYFTQVVWLNQRHLIVGVAIGLGIIYFVLRKILSGRNIGVINLLFLGSILGISTRIHSLVAAAAIFEVLVLMVVFKKIKWITPFLIPAGIFTAFVYMDIIFSGNKLPGHDYIHPGFLSLQPFTLINFIQYWWANLWLELVFIPLGFILSGSKQKKIFLSFFPLFVIANIFQLSFRIEHNHSLLNYFLIVANCYTAYVLVKVWQRGLGGKFTYGLLIVLLTASGILNLLAIKNDFHYPVNDAPTDEYMLWIGKNTNKRAVFLSPQNLYDPVVLSGRRTYLGATYYLQVMGYDSSGRQQLAKDFFEMQDITTLTGMKREGINYVVLPIKPINDFAYSVKRDFYKENLQKVYMNDNVEVYKL